MRIILNHLQSTISHLMALDDTFTNNEVFAESSQLEYSNYIENLNAFESILQKDDNKFLNELYSADKRQMILADLIEYSILGRIYLGMKTIEDKQEFTKLILHFVNLLMSFENMTVDEQLRNRFLTNLKDYIDTIPEESLFSELENHKGNIGLPSPPKELKELNRYFDRLLPKTAGGLWHELLVYIFLLRSDFGHIIPLLLSQRLFSKEDHIVPPDYLLIGKDKKIYGIEVGNKKEIQSGAFSLRTAIPTATIDTINSRVSDRCPICNRWIQFCPMVIENYSNYSHEIEKVEIKCLRECTIYNENEIAMGKCNYTKYSRAKAITLPYTNHKFADGLHYHYKCVLNSVPPTKKNEIIEGKDETAIKTHYPYYSGLEGIRM